MMNREDALVLDVRETGEWSAGHIPAPATSRWAQLDKRMSELEKFKDKPIIIFCATGNRSSSACGQLKKGMASRRSSASVAGISAWRACQPSAHHQVLNRSAMSKVLMYSTAVCPYCVRAEQLLTRKGVTDIEKVRVDLEPERREEMMQKTGQRTVPQIYIGETHVGGCDDLYELERQGKLDALLAA
jgi:glutaredoxin 3